MFLSSRRGERLFFLDIHAGGESAVTRERCRLPRGHRSLPLHALHRAPHRRVARARSNFPRPLSGLVPGRRVKVWNCGPERCDLGCSSVGREYSSQHHTDEKKQVYDKLLDFIGSSTRYHADRLFAHLPSDGVLGLDELSHLLTADTRSFRGKSNSTRQARSTRSCTRNLCL